MNTKDVDSQESKPPRFIPATISSKHRKPALPILLNGKLTSRYFAPSVEEYIDTHTGEIVPTAIAKNHPDFWPELHFAERNMMRESVLQGLRCEVQRFAYFVLKFTNNRRGISPGIDTLVKWYAHLHDKKPHHVRRYIEPIMAAGILATESLLTPLFQRSGKHLRAKEHLSEDFKSSTEFSRMRLSRQPMALGSDSEPFWYTTMQAELKSMIDGVMERIQIMNRKARAYWEPHESTAIDDDEYVEVTVCQ